VLSGIESEMFSTVVQLRPKRRRRGNLIKESQDIETIQLRGGSLASELREVIVAGRERLVASGAPAPVLVTVAVGDQPAAMAYRRSIDRAMQQVQIEHRTVDLPRSIASDSFGETLKDLSADAQVTGILVLMPLPDQIPSQIVHESLLPIKDVDGITPANSGRLHLGLPCLAPSTPQGGMALLDHFRIPVSGKLVCIVGRSNVVGRPLSALMLRRDATVVICHSKTSNLAGLTRQADIVAVATGQPQWLTSDYLRPGATVLDFGINVSGNRIVGDADFEELQGIAGAITPVPGGTGPITALILARNAVAAGFAQHAGSLDSLNLPFSSYGADRL
jgi:methylenetetrahydrofolate dehydrogenase (NADP+) / methenyltetrahydrofolate cyclohydrolase